MNTFADKAALVTGAASRISRATAVAFAREGAMMPFVRDAGREIRGIAAIKEEANQKILAGEQPA